MTLRIRGRDIGPKEGKALLERGVDAETARAALKAAQASAQAKEWTLRSAIGPSSTAEQHYGKTIKALPPPPEREPDE